MQEQASDLFKLFLPVKQRTVYGKRDHCNCKLHFYVRLKVRFLKKRVTDAIQPLEIMKITLL